MINGDEMKLSHVGNYLYVSTDLLTHVSSYNNILVGLVGKFACTNDVAKHATSLKHEHKFGVLMESC